VRRSHRITAGPHHGQTTRPSVEHRRLQPSAPTAQRNKPISAAGYVGGVHQREKTSGHTCRAATEIRRYRAFSPAGVARLRSSQRTDTVGQVDTSAIHITAGCCENCAEQLKKLHRGDKDGLLGLAKLP
jgi:hypothetical protein